MVIIVRRMVTSCERVGSPPHRFFTAIRRRERSSGLSGPLRLAAAAAPQYITTMSATRRGFLSRAALAGGALVLPTGLWSTTSGCRPPVARRTDHYFIFYLLVGGWDLMLVTDPPSRTEGFWVPYDADDVVTAGDVRLGPAMKPLVPYVSRLAILKGIHCDALNHPQARFRMVTGRFKPPGEVVAPSIQTLIAQKTGRAYELPNLSSDQLRPATFRGAVPDLRLEPVRVASIDQLDGLTRVRGGVSAYRREIDMALREKDRLTVDRWKASTTTSTSLAPSFADFADLQRDLSQSEYHHRVRQASSNKESVELAVEAGDRVDRQVRLAVEAVRQDLAPVVTVGTGEFDSHTKSEYASHPAAVVRGLKAVAAIVKGLAEADAGDGRSLLDLTTVVVTSEFSRTPSKNELGGKHHWPTNSMLFVGKGVRPGPAAEPRVFGAVDDNLQALPINPQNGSLRRGVDLLDMSHGLATALAMAGIDPLTAIGQEPISALIA
jgi:hypothetical protein